MTKLRYGLLVSLTVFLLSFLILEPALAMPGGKIASAVFDTFWGKVLLVIITIVLLPLIVYMVSKEWAAQRRTLKDLSYMAAVVDPSFEWLVIRERILDCFTRVHSAWEHEKASEASEWMTSWYWQNQQLVYLDKWASRGLVNHCNVKKITNIKPLLFVHRNSGAPHEDSRLIVSITANMQDYLAERATDRVVEGSKVFKDVETIWTFSMAEGKWRVSNIEDGSMSLAYARLTSQLPKIEDTVVARKIS